MDHKAEKENRKLYWVVAIFVFLGVALNSVSYVGNKIQTGNLGYISGESEWAKAQNRSTFALMRYIKTGDEYYYYEFEKELLIIEGDRVGREELSKENPDLDLAREGFLQGNNRAEEIDEMIWVYQKFQHLGPVRQAIYHWEAGDQIIEQKAEFAAKIRNAFLEGEVTEVQKEEFYSELLTLNGRLTGVEQNFSKAMSTAASLVGTIKFLTHIILSTLLIFLAAFFCISFMRNLRSANHKLMRSENKFRNVLDNSRDVIYQIKIGTDKYDYMSSSVKNMLGYSAEEIMEGGPAFILERTHPDDRLKMEEKIQHPEMDDIEKKLTADSEFRVKKSDGTYIWVNNKRSLLRDSGGNPTAIVGNVRDITLHKQQIEILDKSIVEKQTLLAEIHHRVKNNLAIVSSLIELQKDEVSKEVEESFQVVQSRIKSIALIHEKLYQTTIFSEVELSDYIQELTDIISDTYQSSQKDIHITFELEDVKVDMTTAVPTGLICNELINNSFKHAFKDLQKGEIIIRLRKNCDFISVEVTDNGIGLPPDFDLTNANGLGVTLLNVLTNQLGGEMSVESGGRTSFKLRFPFSKKEKAELIPV